MFPLDAAKVIKDTLLDKQFFLLERLLTDDCPDVRVVAVEGCCRILHLFWEVIPSSAITKILTKIFDDMPHDASNEGVNLDVLLQTLTNDKPLVALRITRLLMPSYFPAEA
ncbi:hypothetical protein Nepgr_032367 [Nepenthes gracilis]|uniref:Uncharacterized protein n=1 Tax=Nepenthes gracilis TaxID=150966 RepID=A0AAD3Y7U2_NEPGR|nr:hypothetical protein Nepgr_032367 [Nepenthes gracilis]